MPEHGEKVAAREPIPDDLTDQQRADVGALRAHLDGERGPFICPVFGLTHERHGDADCGRMEHHNVERSMDPSGHPIWFNGVTWFHEDPDDDDTGCVGSWVTPMLDEPTLSASRPAMDRAHANYEDHARPHEGDGR